MSPATHRSLPGVLLLLGICWAGHVEMELNLTRGSFNGRPWVLVNGNPIGPTLEAQAHDTVTVHLHNHLDEPATVHHHGLHQLNTSHFDGVHGVSQPAVPPYSSWSYQFLAWPPGSALYHGHTGLLSSNGFRGGVIVRPIIEDPFAGMYSAEFTWVLAEFQQLKAETSLDQLVDGSYASEGDEPYSDLVLDGIMLNGDLLGNSDIPLQYPVGGTRIRLSNAGSHWALVVSFESHWLVVLALDGQNIEPFLSEKVVLHPGERVDILTAPQRRGVNCKLHVGTQNTATSTSIRIASHQSCLDSSIRSTYQ